MDTNTILATIAVFFTFYLIYFNLKAFSYWKSRGVRGPTPWPLLGTNVYYILYPKLELEAYWHKKYGGYYGIYEGYKPALRVSDHEIIRDVWIKNFSKFTDRHARYIYGDIQRRWVFWSKGNLWNSQRSLMTPMFTSLKMKERFGTMIDCVNFFNKEIDSPRSQELVSDPPKDLGAHPKSKVITRDILMSLALDVIASSLFGLKLDTYKDRNGEFYKRAFSFAFFDVPHFIMWLMTPHFILKWFKHDLTTYSKFEYFDKLTQSQIDMRRKSKLHESKDFIQSLMDAEIPKQLTVETFNIEDDNEAHYNANIDHNELEKFHREQTKKAQFRKFDDAEIRGQTTFFFLAGFETTSTTLSFCLYELAHQQAAQQEVYEELMSQSDILSNKTEYSALSTLVKLDAFISETMRLHSIVTEHNRVCTSDDGALLVNTSPPLRVPKGMPISACSYEIQNDPKLWNTPERFDMTRFYPENKSKIHPGSYMPFGLGPRNCVGMRFALLVIKLTLTKTLIQFHVTPGPSTKEYPPKLARHAFFSQLLSCDFTMTPRNV